MITRKLELCILGDLWWGGIAAMDHTIAIGKGPFRTDIDPTFDDIEDNLYRWTGDFQRVIDYHAALITVEYDPIQRCDIKRYHVIKDWASDENSFTYADCMFPECA